MLMVNLPTDKYESCECVCRRAICRVVCYYVTLRGQLLTDDCHAPGVVHKTSRALYVAGPRGMGLCLKR